MTEWKAFSQAIQAQFRVIGALLMWEVITRYGRDNLGFIWLFLEPMIFTLAVTALWYGIGMARYAALPVVAFAMTGYSSVLLWRNCANRCSMAVKQNVGLLYHRPVRVLDVLVAKTLLEIAGATMSLITLAALWISLDWMEPPDDILKVVGAWLLLAWFGATLGLILGALTSFSELMERFWHPTAYIMFPLSGAAFMVDWLSPDFQSVVLWLPIVHGVEMLRDGFSGPIIKTHYNPLFVVNACLIMTMIGLALTRIASRNVKFA